ncbi:MAG TPA: PspC domain-containing protein [Woeseiaceae bacterium]|nr:PspC domain-containing protein [Woeseiaceae bacterium]
MAQSTWNIDQGPLRGFYRDRENGWIFGVCAGLADRFNLNLGMIRILAVVSLLLFSWLTILLYVGATLLIKQKPLIYSGRDNEYDFWRRRHDKDWRHS